MMKSKGIILIAMLCIFAISGCSKETNTTAADSETSSTQITTSAEETFVKNKMTIILKDNKTGDELKNKVVEDEEKITAFNQMCSELNKSSDEKYSEAFFDSITTDEYTLNFSSSDFTETASEKEDAVIVECNGLSYELAAGGEEWQKIADFLDSISK